MPKENLQPGLTVCVGPVDSFLPSAPDYNIGKTPSKDDIKRKFGRENIPPVYEHGRLNAGGYVGRVLNALSLIPEDAVYDINTLAKVTGCEDEYELRTYLDLAKAVMAEWPIEIFVTTISTQRSAESIKCVGLRAKK